MEIYRFNHSQIGSEETGFLDPLQKVALRVLCLDSSVVWIKMENNRDPRGYVDLYPISISGIRFAGKEICNIAVFADHISFSLKGTDNGLSIHVTAPEELSVQVYRGDCHLGTYVMDERFLANFLQENSIVNNEYQSTVSKLKEIKRGL